MALVVFINACLEHFHFNFDPHRWTRWRRLEVRVGIRYFFPEGSSRTKLESANKVLRDDDYSKSYKNLSVGSRHEHRSAFSEPSLDGRQ